jgi:hypothetical protein
MWRAREEFVNLKPHGYWPRDVAYAPAGYDPGQGENADPDEGVDSRDNGSATAAGGGSHADLWAS